MRFFESEFLNDWHLTDELDPRDLDDIFFYADGEVYVGKYDESSKLYFMADHLGYDSEDVKAWMYVPYERRYSSYPENGKRIAFSTAGFDCLVTGVYDESRGRLGSVIIDPIYKDVDDDKKKIDFTKVVDWIPVPEYKLNEELAQFKPSLPGIAKPSKPGKYVAKEIHRDSILKDFPGAGESLPKATPCDDITIPNELPGKGIDLSKEPKEISLSQLDKTMGGVINSGLGSMRRLPKKGKTGELKTNKDTGIPEYNTWSGIKYSGERKTYSKVKN